MRLGGGILDPDAPAVRYGATAPDDQLADGFERHLGKRVAAPQNDLAHGTLDTVAGVVVCKYPELSGDEGPSGYPARGSLWALLALRTRWPARTGRPRRAGKS